MYLSTLLEKKFNFEPLNFFLFFLFFKDCLDFNFFFLLPASAASFSDSWCLLKNTTSLLESFNGNSESVGNK
jgi:hypothetical protein